MTTVTVKPTVHLEGTICAPPSKAYTQRMLIASAFSHGTSRISNPLLSDDTEAALRAVRALGAKIDLKGNCWTVEGALCPKASKRPIDCGESGATLRFMVPIAALASKPTTFLLGPGLAKRPIQPLLDTLKQLGVQAQAEKEGEKATVRVEGGGIRGGKAFIAGDVSSQFISGLMFACPLADADTELSVTTPLESKIYVKMTQSVLKQYGVKVAASEDYRQIHVPSKQKYLPSDGRVPGDFSSAAFLLAAAAITNSKIQVLNLDYKTVQGDKAILGILKKMGIEGAVCTDSVEIMEGNSSPEAFDVDASNIPDLVPICAVLACYAKGTSTIRNAQRLRLKESDRLESIHAELHKMGADVAMGTSSLTVKGPCKLHGATINPHNDHRIAMACTVAALRAEGETTIRNAECVRKSYPQFFQDLRTIGADVIGGKLDR